ncbi:hypothetical protein F5877DRAFT_72626 [Lentinula edodes]|nr:hypothetical protein F5877DRAFT_72626 [Lentinula edodes]
MGSNFKFPQVSCFEISLALIEMDLRENRCVCLGEVGVKDAVKPGVYQEIPFVRGGYRRPPVPICIICEDAQSAAFIYGLLQPYVKANASEENFVQEFLESAAFQAVANEVDKRPGFRWAVKHGKSVGVFLSGIEALLSVDLAEDVKWKQAYAFHTLKEAVLFQMQGNRNPANYVWEYNPLQQPDTADTIRQLVEQPLTPVPSPPPTPPPAPKSPKKATFKSHSSSDASILSRSPSQTPSRSQGAGSSTGIRFFASPRIYVNVNQEPITMDRRSHLADGAYWSRRIMANLHFTPSAADKVENAINTYSKADFVQWFHIKFPHVEETWAEFMWDMHARL